MGSVRVCVEPSKIDSQETWTNWRAHTHARNHQRPKMPAPSLSVGATSCSSQNTKLLDCFFPVFVPWSKTGQCGFSGVVVRQTGVHHVRRVELRAGWTPQTASWIVFEGRAEALIGEAHDKVFLSFRWKWTKQAKDATKWTKKWISKSGEMLFTTKTRRRCCR
jgi:hypothetical protein